jgi:hypothetical protein
MSGRAHDRHEAEAWANEHGWLEDDPAAALARRFPDATIPELKALAAIAARRSDEEAGIAPQAAPSPLPTRARELAQALLEFAEALDAESRT